MITIVIRTTIAISSSNWLFIWAGIELNLLSFIPIILLSNSNQETEASIKYFIAQALGSRIILISSLSLWFYSIVPINSITMLLTISIILKIGIAPCHLWYPSVITSISWVSCLLLSTWQKLAPLSVICFILSKSSITILLWIRALNAIVGGIVGINQAHLRTIIAYSSITHIGWITSLAAINKLIPTMVYFTIYSILISPIFIIFQKFSINTRMSINKFVTKAPFIQILIPILILSLGGLPPLTGFIPKWIALEILSQVNPYVLFVLILGAMINLYFYINITFNMLLSPILRLTNTHIPVKIPIKLITIISLMLLSLSPIFILIYAMIILN